MLDPDLYAQFVAKYLTYLDLKKVHVDVLGLDNEGSGNKNATSNNDGNITSARFAAIVKALKTHYKGTFPALSFNDGIHPDAATLCHLTADQRKLVAHRSTHANSNRRHSEFGALKELATAACAAGSPADAWETEEHWSVLKTDKKPIGEYVDAVVGMETLFDHFDSGYKSIDWWAYLGQDEASDAPHQNGQESLQRNFVHSLAGAATVSADDRDGVTCPDRESLCTRAFRSGKDLVVWVINDTATSYAAVPVGFSDKRKLSTTASIGLVRWKRAGTNDLFQEGADVTVKDRSIKSGVASLKVPARTISSLRVVNAYA